MAEEHSVGLPQQQHPAQSPTGTHGFFSTLLSPLYGPPRSLPRHGSSGHLEAQLTSSMSSQDLHGGRSSAATTPSASPTTASPTMSRQAPMDLHYSTNNTTTTLRQLPNPEYSANPSHPAAVATAVPPPQPLPQQEQQPRRGYMSSLFHFKDAPSSNALAPVHPAGAASTTNSKPSTFTSSSTADGSSGPNTGAHSGAPRGSQPASFASGTASQQQQQQRYDRSSALLPPPPLPAARPAASPQHDVSNCAPHMMGYRQCLEVNPDFKTNCTWALDSYMRCKEDMEL